MNTDVARAFRPYLTTPEGRKFLENIGAVEGAPIILCRDDESIESVMRRVITHDSRTTVASLGRSGEFRFLGVSPGNPTEPEGVADVSVQSPIGMLIDMTRNAGRVRIRLTSWTSVDSSPLPQVPEGQLALC